MLGKAITHHLDFPNFTITNSGIGDLLEGEIQKISKYRSTDQGDLQVNFCNRPLAGTACSESNRYNYCAKQRLNYAK